LSSNEYECKPLLATLGTGDSYTLNLVKCALGSVGFVLMGLLTAHATVGPMYTSSFSIGPRILGTIWDPGSGGGE
jgi:hypothetical protein